MMQYFCRCATIAALIALVSLHFAPHSWSVPGMFAVYLCLALTTFVECFSSPRKIWSATKKAAKCSCDKAVEGVGKLPELLQSNCASCGAEMA